MFFLSPLLPAPENPKKLCFLSKFLKINDPSPQILENKKPFSLNPQKSLGGPQRSGHADISTNVILKFDEMSRMPDNHFIEKKKTMSCFWKLRAWVKGTGATGVCSMLAKDTYFLGTLINNPDAVALSNMSKNY